MYPNRRMDIGDQHGSCLEHKRTPTHRTAVLSLVAATLVLLMTGCAARAVSTSFPRVMNLGLALANEKAIWWVDGAGCHLQVKKADGTELTFTPSAEECTWGEIWVKAQAAQPAPVKSE